MKDKLTESFDACRRVHPRMGGSPRGALYGYFVAGPLRIISSGVPDPGEPQWEHVSVSCIDRCPTWAEMHLVKQMFWSDDETVLQFHPRKSEYVNRHEYALHLWRQVGVDHPLPPNHLV